MPFHSWPSSQNELISVHYTVANGLNIDIVCTPTIMMMRFLYLSSTSFSICRNERNKFWKKTNKKSEEVFS